MRRLGAGIQPCMHTYNAQTCSNVRPFIHILLSRTSKAHARIYSYHIHATRMHTSTQAYMNECTHTYIATCVHTNTMRTANKKKQIQHARHKKPHRNTKKLGRSPQAFGLNALRQILCALCLLLHLAVYTYMHAYIHTYMHAYIHTYIHT